MGGGAGTLVQAEGRVCVASLQDRAQFVGITAQGPLWPVGRKRKGG